MFGRRSNLAFISFLIAAAIAAPALAQQKPTPIAPAAPLKDGWEDIDQRLVFLMVRLANTEASLDAVEKQLGITATKERASVGEAKLAQQGNVRMDRQGGGPMRWSDFYGRTAERFFYHPVDQSTTYHTSTVLKQQQSQPLQEPGKAAGSQGVPVAQRPPQFDYIYRANEEAKNRAEKEAAEIRTKRDQLINRRRALEEEQSALWCEIAFRAVSHYDLDRKPLYRFEPLLTTDADATTKKNADTMKSATVFMRRALTVVNEAQKDQASTFRNVKQVIADSRDRLDDTWLRLAVDTNGRNTSEARFAALAKHLDDVASNLSDSYKVSVDGDRFKDELRKNTFRGLLQESLVNYAEALLALDEMSTEMAGQWKIKPDIDKPLTLSAVGAAPTISSSGTTTGPVDEYTLNRSAAETVIGLGSRIGIEVDGKMTYFDDQSTLPTRPFIIGDVSCDNNQRITDADLALLHGLRKLKWLSVLGTRVSDAGLDHLSDLENLERIALGQTAITDAGLKKLRYLRKLRRLYLPSTLITDAGLVDLASLDELEYLALRGDNVTDEGLRAIAPLGNLVFLNLAGTKVTNSGMRSLRPLTLLKTIVLSPNVDEAALKRVLPQCEVVRPKQ